VTVMGASGLMAFTIYVFLAIAPGPVAISIAPDSLTLTYKSGRTRVYDLTRGKSQLTIWAYQPPEPGWPLQYPLHSIVGGIPNQNGISPEAYNCILDMARENGLVVERLPGSAYKATLFRLRIHPPDEAARPALA